MARIQCLLLLAIAPLTIFGFNMYCDFDYIPHAIGTFVVFDGKDEGESAMCTFIHDGWCLGVKPSDSRDYQRLISKSRWNATFFYNLGDANSSASGNVTFYANLEETYTGQATLVKPVCCNTNETVGPDPYQSYQSYQPVPSGYSVPTLGLPSALSFPQGDLVLYYISNWVGSAVAANGTATNGTATDGAATNGTATDSAATNGTAVNGTAAEDTDLVFEDTIEQSCINIDCRVPGPCQTYYFIWGWEWALNEAVVYRVTRASDAECQQNFDGYVPGSSVCFNKVIDTDDDFEDYVDDFDEIVIPGSPIVTNNHLLAVTREVKDDYVHAYDVNEYLKEIVLQMHCYDSVEECANAIKNLTLHENISNLVFGCPKLGDVCSRQALQKPAPPCIPPNTYLPLQYALNPYATPAINPYFQAYGLQQSAYLTPVQSYQIQNQYPQQTNNQTAYGTTYSSPPQQQPQQTYSSPPKQQPQQSYSSPTQQQPQQTYSSPPQQQPAYGSTYSSPPKQQPQQTYSSPHQQQPQQSYSSPTQQQPKQTYSSPHQQQPAYGSTYSSPPQKQSQQTYSSPPQQQPEYNQYPPQN